MLLLPPPALPLLLPGAGLASVEVHQPEVEATLAVSEEVKAPCDDESWPQDTKHSISIDCAECCQSTYTHASRHQLSDTVVFRFVACSYLVVWHVDVHVP